MVAAPTMIPPPSPLGRRAIAPDDAAGARVNPVALLWAHQLRREHKVLVGQITALEGLVGTVRADVGRNCGEFESVKDEVGYVRGEVGTVRSEVKSVMDEMQKVREELKTIREEIRGLGEDRKKWKEEKMAEMEKERPETREELEEKFMTEVGRLRDEVEEMRRGIEVSKSRPSLGRYSTPSVPPATQPSPRASNRARPPHARLASTILGTPSTRGSCPPSMELIPESLPQPLPPVEPSSPPFQLADDFTQASSILPRLSPWRRSPCPTLRESRSRTQPRPQPKSSRQLKSSPDDPLRQLEQNYLSLSAYLELGESVIAKFPRRRDESRVVQAFWEGLSGADDRKVVEDRLERDGWGWRMVRDAVQELIEQSQKEEVREMQRQNEMEIEEERQMEGRRKKQKEMEKQTDAGAQNKPRKKRRVIPIVWATKEEENEWMAQLRRWQLQSVTSPGSKETD